LAFFPFSFSTLGTGIEKHAAISEQHIADGFDCAKTCFEYSANRVAMGFLSRFAQPVPSTAEDPAAIQTAAHRKTEKPDISQVEAGNQNSNGGNVYHVTPEMEQRVVRKLDKRLVPLVMGLYLLAYLDRSNIGQVPSF
jgi:hypothetical protein